MLHLKTNYIYTKRRAYPAIEEIKQLCKENSCCRNEHMIVFREFDRDDYDCEILNFKEINRKNFEKNDKKLNTQRLDLYLKKQLNNKLNDIYGDQEATLSIEGEDEDNGYQSASNISIEWGYQLDNRRYWDLKLYTRHLDERLFSEIDYTLLDSDGRPTRFDEKPPEIFKDFCKNLSLIIEKHKLR